MAQGPQVKFVQFPKDGLNVLTSDVEFLPTEAKRLDNFYVLQDGIYPVRPPGQTSVYKAGSGGTAAVYMDATGAYHVISGGKSSATDKNAIWVDWAPIFDEGDLDSGGNPVVITDNKWNFFQFGAYLFCCNGTNDTIRIKIADNTFTQSMWDVGNYSFYRSGCNFKHRCYFIYGNTLIKYGGIDAVQGPVTPWDISYVCKESSRILFITPWSYNQGLSNDELLVVVMTTGEVLVYGGLWPQSPDWTLLSRTKIPLPTGDRAWIAYGQDIYIATVRGIVSLSRYFTGRASGPQAYTVSFKLGYNAKFQNCTPCIAQGVPLMFWAGGVYNSLQRIWVLNYETGAWSSFTTGDTATFLSLIPNYQDIPSLGYNQAVIFAMDSDKYRWDWGGTDISDSRPLSAVWESYYDDFAMPLQKRVSLSRLLTKVDACVTNNTPVGISQELASNYEDDYGDADTRGYTAAIASPVALHKTEYAPPGIGHQLSVKTILGTSLPAGKSSQLLMKVVGMWLYLEPASGSGVY